MRSREFFKALLHDPEAALRKAGWYLAPRDMKLLTQALDGKPVLVRFNAVKFIKSKLDNPGVKGWTDTVWKKPWPHRPGR